MTDKELLEPIPIGQIRLNPDPLIRNNSWYRAGGVTRYQPGIQKMKPVKEKRVYRGPSRLKQKLNERRRKEAGMLT